MRMGRNRIASTSTGNILSWGNWEVVQVILHEDFGLTIFLEVMPAENFKVCFELFQPHA